VAEGSGIQLGQLTEGFILQYTGGTKRGCRENAKSLGDPMS